MQRSLPKRAAKTAAAEKLQVEEAGDSADESDGDEPSSEEGDEESASERLCTSLPRHSQ